MFEGTKLWIKIATAALVLFVVACGGEDSVSAPSPSALEPSPETVLPTTGPLVSSETPTLVTSDPVDGTATVMAAEHPDLGTILVDGRGRTLYLFTGDERDQSSCVGSCADSWPPLSTAGDVSAGEDVTVQALETITRDDGSNQVTYNGWPLYHFARDETPGDAKGQNTGGVWFVVSVYGGPIQTDAAVEASEHPDLGTILSDASGRTLYLFTVDERNRPNCLGGCALAWPPLLTVGNSTADEGIDGERLGKVTRDDGSEQVTYNGWPLYYYALDRRPGDARGQNSGFIWHVVSTYGGPIQTNAVVKTTDHPALGTILAESSGRTLYLSTLDASGNSRCIRACALAWPPLLTLGDPAAEEGVASGRLGSIRREDGYLQVTYNGWPLYYFAPDETPGDAMGQGAGGAMYVVSPGGEALTITVPTPTAMDHDPATQMPTVPAAPPSPTPVPKIDESKVPTESSDPTSPPAIGLPPSIQELATIENYPASQFFPPTVIVIKDVPVKLLMTRLHSEHINKFTIEPFVFSRPFAQPGAVANVEFTPNQSGQFKMSNIGHFFDGDFIVADSVADAKSIVAQRGIQEFSLIHDLETGSSSPARTIIQKDIPVRVYNTSLKGDGQVSISPFYESTEVNVRERRITTFEFLPNIVGEFAIRDGNDVVIGTLVVE